MSDTNSRDSFEYLDNELTDPTLESILAEFKGSAYIAGDKKTSPNLLDERIRRIVKESQDGSIASTELFTFEEDNGDFFHDIRDPFDEHPKEEAVTLTEEDKKLAAKTAEIDWEPVRAATSFDEARKEAAAFFAKRDEAVEKREEELLLEKQEAKKRAEEEARIKAVEERRLKEEEELRRREESRLKAHRHMVRFDELSVNKAESDNEANSVISFAEVVSDENSEESAETVFLDETETDSADDNSSTEILFFDNYRFAENKGDGEEYAESGDYEQEDYDDAEPEVKRGFFSRLFSKRSDPFEQDYEEYESYPADEDYFEAEEEVYIEEPDFKQEASALAKKRNVLMLSSRVALLVAFVMGIFSILFDKGVSIFGIGDNVALFTSVMVVMQLLVMLLALEVLSRGITSLLRREVTAETLILLSNVITVIASCVAIKGKNAGMGAPFCAVSAFAAAFSLWGEYRQIAAMSLSLKTAVSSSNPLVISDMYVKDIDCSLVRKFSANPAGFYNNLVETDIAEGTYKIFAPFLLIATVLLSGVSALSSSNSYIYCLSATAAACGSFTALSAFSVPFSIIAKRLRRTGSAVAGWGGADDFHYADGVRLTDEDIFPAGTQVSGPTALENVKPDKIMRYSASLMIASNSGLSKGFEDLMNKQGLTMIAVENFECYEGGYGAVIRGERVVCGSAACMALMGIQIPQSVNSKNAVFTAINDTLVGTFTVTYKPYKSVQNSLVALLRSKIKLYFAVRDFNITPLMVQQKLQIPVDDIEYLPSTDAYRLTDDVQENVPHTAAVVVRNAPGVYADTVTGARNLRKVAAINTALSLFTTILGMVVVFILGWRGEGMMKPSNLLEYMIAAEAAIILLSNTIGLY